MRPIALAILCIALNGAAGCCHFQTASATASAPITGGTHQIQDTLYFGAQRQDGQPVSIQEWQTFLDEVITPRFPEGLTVIDGQGQWRTESGTVVKESSRVLILIHPARPDCTIKINEIIAEYEHRFQQESVLHVRESVFVHF